METKNIIKLTAVIVSEKPGYIMIESEGTVEDYRFILDALISLDIIKEYRQVQNGFKIKYRKRSRSTKLSVETLIEITKENNPSLDEDSLREWFEYKQNSLHPYCSKMVCKKIANQFRGKEYLLRDAVNHSIASGYQGLFLPRTQFKPEDKKNLLEIEEWIRSK